MKLSPPPPPPPYLDKFSQLKLRPSSAGRPAEAGGRPRAGAHKVFSHSVEISAVLFSGISYVLCVESVQPLRYSCYSFFSSEIKVGKRFGPISLEGKDEKDNTIHAFSLSQ